MKILKSNHKTLSGSLASICFVLLINPLAYGQERNVQVEADVVVHNLESSDVEFKGNVVVTRDDVRLKADLLKYSTTQDGEEVARAEGSPVFAETDFVNGIPQLRIYSNQVTIYRHTDQIEFVGNVKIERDDVVVNAPKATYFSETRNFETLSDEAVSESSEQTTRTTATIFQD